MLACNRHHWLRCIWVGILALAAAGAQDSTTHASQSPVQSSTPSSSSKAAIGTFDQFIDLTIRQEERLSEFMRNFRPIVETYLQEQKPDPKLKESPKTDRYFLSRLDPGDRGDVVVSFTGEQEEAARAKKRFHRRKKKQFAAGGFVLALFPDVDHFNRQNYTFDFVRWENLGEVRCAVVNVYPVTKRTKSRGFVGRIWVEDRDHSIVRFTGAYTAKPFAKRAFHFDSWRLNLLDIRWMPAYVYTEESDPHDFSERGLWFKAQTRVWGYDLANAGDHREYAKRLTDTPGLVDPKRNEASQNLSPDLTVGKETYTPEDRMVERLQVAGLMAPDGEVDKILETVVNNLQVTNDLDLAAVRCRVLLTTPLESFVVGRTIVVSRGLLDVLPDEATLAAVLAHELAHIVLQHSTGAEYMRGLELPFSDMEIFSHLNFQFNADQETEADKKGMALFAKSPYAQQVANAGLFLKALATRSPQLPNLLHGRFSNDFGSSHLVGMPEVAKSPEQLQMESLQQIAALPLGSRISLDPWSDRIVMLKGKPVHLDTPAEKMPFEVAPFFPHLKRLGAEKASN